MVVVEPLDSTEDLLECVFLRCNTANDVHYTTLKVIMNPKKQTASWYDIVDFINIKSIVQVVRQKYGIAEYLRRVHGAAHRLCFNWFVKLGSAVEKES